MNILDNYRCDYELIKNYDVKSLRNNLVLPIKKDEYFITVIVCDESSDLELFDTNLVIKEIKSSKNEILFCLDDFEEKYDIFINYKNSIQENQEKSIHVFFDFVLRYSLEKKCSDIHIETLSGCLIIRLRIDGILKTFFSFDLSFYLILSSYIKLISNMDITEKRKPQNARFEKQVLNKDKIDFRVSTMPTITGESIVLRILDNGTNKKELNNIGFDNLILEKVKRTIIKSNGLILVTGPTGSGKTTTLYSILNELNDNSKKIITIEDPVEYQIKGIQQVAINNAIGLSFNDVLKNILRQDPDIIMIGEIRDEESLSIAIQASLTGHLVFSTLHTNDSISTLSRLFDLNAKPYLVASTLRAVIAQRLVLKLCLFCEDGCSKCNYTRFEGRLSLFEFLEFDENISSIVANDFDKNKIMHYVKSIGFKSLFDDAKEKIEKNLTTKDEVNKVLF
ncbi:GspE/PulE family protein [Arcobacter sp.]|uniref:GspE/PulE family protein n=1 Tax=unclassified Arcobacter TaxID=2593671 RepID=UPI003AFFF2BA